jgi:hypothetical protein
MTEDFSHPLHSLHSFSGCHPLKFKLPKYKITTGAKVVRHSRPTAQVRGLNRKSGAKYRRLHDFIDNRGPGGYSVGNYTLEG